MAGDPASDDGDAGGHTQGSIEAGAGPALHKQAGYEAIVKAMSEDGQRSERARQVEASFGQALPQLLAELDQAAQSRSSMLRRLNRTLEANGHEQGLSRATLYSWLDEYGLK